MGEKSRMLSFRIQDNEILNDGVNKYFDKVPTKFADWSEDEFRSAGFRAVPGAVARRGSFVAKNVVLMLLMSISAHTLTKARWSILGRPSVLAPKSVKTST